MIYDELNVCAAALLLGVRLKVCYDILRVFRKIIPHHIVFISLEDLIFFTYAGLVSFGIIYVTNDGVVRAFIIEFICLGALIYNLVLGKRIFWLLEKIIGKIKKTVRKVLKKVAKKVKIIVYSVSKIRKADKD